MKKLNLIMLGLLFLSGCALQERHPAQYQQTDEVLVNVGIPLKSIEREINKLAQTSSIIKQINFIRLDPQTRILSVKGVIHYPLDSLFNFGTPAPKETPVDHTFELAVSFPTAKELSQIKYFRLKFHRFRINGDDYLNAFSIVASFLQTVMANSDLIHYVFDQAGSQIKNPDAMTMMKEIVESNGFIVNQTTRTVSVKLNLNYFSQFQMYDEIKDLRLWYFGPDLLGGTKNYTVFRVVAGIGKPSDLWVTRHLADVDQDNNTLQDVKNSLYKQYSNHQQVATELSGYLNTLLASEKILPQSLPINYQREIESFKSNLQKNARDVLTLENELFAADPENEYLNFVQVEQGRVRAFFSDMDRRLTIDDLIRGGADPLNKHLPIVTKRISQDLLNSAMNFVRDIEVDGQYFIKEAHVVLAPHIPGLILKGRINIDLNYLMGKMNSGFIGKKANTSALSDDGLPFELVLETKMGNQGWFGIDPKSIKLFDGDRRLSFDRNSSNHQFFLDFVKVYLVQTLAALSVDMNEDAQTPEQKRERKLKDLDLYLKSVKQGYSNVTSRSGMEEMLKVMALDLEKNPFATAGEDYLRKKGQILFSNLIGYDQNEKMFKIRLDPRVVLDNIEGVENNLQVWNLSPTTSQDLNNTFLEMTVGNGPRGKRYVEKLTARSQDLDHAGFSGLYRDFDRSAVDMLASINFHYLENYVNQLLQGMIKLQNSEYEQALKEDVEQSHTLLDNVTVHVGENKRLFLKLKATMVSKKKRTMSWLFSDKWKVEKDSYGLNAEIELNSRRLDEVAKNLREDKLPLYFNQEAIGILLNKVQIEFGKPSLVNSALSAMTNLNLDTALGTKFRRLILKIVSIYFNSQYKPSSHKKLLGHELEEMVKVLTTTEEIILLLNPRLAGAAFELKLTGKEKKLQEALKIDTLNQEMHLAFTGSAAMAKIDKRDLIKISEDAAELITPYLSINNGSALAKELNKNLFADKAILASDKSKLSLYNRLLSGLRKYDQVINLTTIPHPAINADKRITSCGVELMYFAGTSFILHQQLNKLIQKIVNLKAENQVTQYAALVEARDKLKSHIWLPLARRYQSHHLKLNEQLILNPGNYWTYQFYADAFFGEKVFSVLKKEGSGF